MARPIDTSTEADRKTKEMRLVEISNQRVTSEALFGKLRELVILHENEEYRLRITANNKLILTK